MTNYDEYLSRKNDSGVSDVASYTFFALHLIFVIDCAHSLNFRNSIYLDVYWIIDRMSWDFLKTFSFFMKKAGGCSLAHVFKIVF